MEEPQLLQLRYLDDPWKVLVCCVLLNRTQRAQVDRMIDQLFDDYPSADVMAHAKLSDLYRLLKPLGFNRTRAERLVALAELYVKSKKRERLLTREEVSALPGIGAYGLDCYRLLVLGDTDLDPGDKELKRWARWKGVPPIKEKTEGV